MYHLIWNNHVCELPVKNKRVKYDKKLCIKKFAKLFSVLRKPFLWGAPVLNNQKFK